jgi:ADP-heptose:LPS heptosyltransferase
VTDEPTGPDPRSGVLVARLDNCGDVVLTGPTVRAVGATGKPVYLLCGPRGRAAAALLPGVSRILEMQAPWIEPDPTPVRRRQADELVAAVRRLGVADALVLGSSHQSPLPLALLLRWAGVGRIAAVSHEHAGSLLDVRIPGDPDLHEVRRNLLVAERLGFPAPADDRLAVRLDAQSARVGASRAPGLDGRPYVVVHPGASVPARTLSASRWREATEALVAEGWGVVVTGSREEDRLTARVVGDASGVRDLGGRTTLGELAAVIDGAAAFVGGNTGPVHLAAAVGTPVVTVFAPTVPLSRWRPWRVRHVVLGSQEIACAGCRSRVCPLPEQHCLSHVGPADIVAAVQALVAPVEPRSGPAGSNPDRHHRSPRGITPRPGASLSRLPEVQS